MVKRGWVAGKRRRPWKMYSRVYYWRTRVRIHSSWSLSPLTRINLSLERDFGIVIIALAVTTKLNDGEWANKRISREFCSKHFFSFRRSVILFKFQSTATPLLYSNNFVQNPSGIIVISNLFRRQLGLCSVWCLRPTENVRNIRPRTMNTGRCEYI